MYNIEKKRLKYILVISILLILLFERYLFYMSFEFFEEHEYTENINVLETGYDFIIPITYKSNWAFLRSTERINTAYIYNNESSADNGLNEFCKTRKCFHTFKKDEYPIILSQFFKSFCEIGNLEGFWKIDDDAFLSELGIDKCQTYCSISDSCCMCSAIFGGKVDYTLSNEYYFPAGRSYYLNKKSKEVLCSSTKIPKKLNEDNAIGKILSIHCSKLKIYDISDYSFHRKLEYLNTNIEIVKEMNH